MPGFPHPQPCESYWQMPEHELANHRTTPELPTTKEHDYVIIGSGISGAAVAFKLLDRNPNLSILMLEARTAASGASGRNGGHCRTGYWLAFKTMVERFGEDEAFKILRLEENNVQDIADFVQQHDVENDFCQVETSDTSFHADKWAEVLDVSQAFNEAQQRRPQDAPVERRTIYQGAAAAKYVGMPEAKGTAVYPAYTQNPYLLVCKMLQLSIDKGLNLQTNTFASRIYQEGLNWNVETDRGIVTGRRLVLATNAYTGALHRGLAQTGFMIPSRSQVSALPLGKSMKGTPDMLLHRSNGLNDLGTGDYFFYKHQTGHLVYGGGRGHSKTGDRNTVDDSTVNRDIADYFQRVPAEVFGEAAWGESGEAVKEWSGIVCYTPDRLPLVGESPTQKGLWLTAAFNGHGSKLLSI